MRRKGIPGADMPHDNGMGVSDSTMVLAISAVSSLIVLAGFMYGAVHLLNRKKPLFLKLLVCSTGCYALETLSNFVNELTGGFDYAITLGYLGFFGALLFLLSANYGALDRLVDDGHPVKYHLIAAFAPIISGMMLIRIFFGAKVFGAAAAVVTLLIMFPVVPASFFSCKHLILPEDPIGLLKVNRLSNLCALVFYASNLLSALAMIKTSETASMCFSLIAAVASAGISAFAVRGERRWKI